MADTKIESLDNNNTSDDDVNPLLNIDGVDDNPPADDGDDDTGNDDQQPVGNTRTMSEAEYDMLMEKAGVIDLIQENPQLSAYITDTLRNGMANTQPGVEDVADSDDYANVDIANHPAFKSLEQRITRAEQGSSQAAAAARIMSFGQDHSDLSEYQMEITELVQKHGMDLPTAYKYAKALAGNNGTTAPNKQSRAGAAEGHGRVSNASRFEDNDVLSAAEGKINDPSRRVAIGEALDIANAAAILAHNSEEP